MRGCAVLSFVTALALAVGCGGDGAGGPSSGRPDGGGATDGSGGASGPGSSLDGSSPDANGAGRSSLDAGDPDDAGPRGPNDGATGNSDGGQGSDQDASTAADSGSDPSSDCADDCDDDIDCTVDACVNRICTHAVNAEVCDPGEACDIRGPGCTATSACANANDCADSDPCTTQGRCNTSIASCEWEFLDADGDGHPPKGCGGDDPDDTNTNVRPGAADVCDGEDNDDDGETDEEPEASASCITGTCADCSIGCQRFSDIDELYAPSGDALPGLIGFDLVHALCNPNLPTQAACIVTHEDDFFSSDCDACLSDLAECGEPCFCGTSAESVPSCYSCLCDRGCVDAFEACSGIEHPAECN